ncbi:MAG: hypothetical protein MJ135_06960 [Oscillospiraceae bacterium]|nr:hypothetical protein [Oscillospiraceae bacterium]
MSNPILDLMRGSQPRASAPGNMFDAFRAFSQALNGNPQDIVQQLMASGRMSQAQFQQYGQMANNILRRK